MYKSLEKTLEKLNSKALGQQERKFVETFMAIAYFKIPEYREKFLQCVSNDDDVIIDEWRGIEYLLNDDED